MTIDRFGYPSGAKTLPVPEEALQRDGKTLRPGGDTLRPAGPASSRNCPCCHAAMRAPIGFRHDCPACGFSAAQLAVRIGVDASPLSESAREVALAPLRAANFTRVLDRLAPHVPQRAALLEVGCAHGWFLDAAAARGYVVHGIEPDAAVAAQALGRGHRVATGYFPEALDPGTRYEVVVFNDVLEHLPDPSAALRAAHAVLGQDGVLVVNIPSNHGTLYRAADLLRRCGWRGPHDRLWQVGFPSPHLSYFNPPALAQCAGHARFAEIDRVPLPSVAHAGLWARLRYDRRAPVPACALTWLAISAAVPALRRLPPDIVLQLFRRIDP